VLVYDEFDIWLVDPVAKKPPVNLTNGYGRKHHIMFRLSGERYGNKKVPHTGTILITAFNQDNKNNGFYQLRMNKREDPELLTMGPFVYEIPEYGLGGAPPIKAANARIYLVKRSDAAHSPNYYWTSNFKQFLPISQVYPEKNYNWLTTKLMTFKTLDNREEQGILYQPEDFDSARKYPLIIHYYERKSMQLNRYQPPASVNGDIDIPFFVSQGYLIFEPDIHYPIGYPGQGAYNTVIAIAKELGKHSWIDSAHIGIQGHSFGGFETYYLATHSHLFAAAVASCGPTDLISWYGSYSDWVPSYQSFIELAILRTNTTLWETPELYIKNSPIFQADKITTPLLTMANKQDGNVPFSQGLEFFTALRRLGKPAWMLQYDRGSHGVGGKEYIDYMMRMIQFFNYYLKNMPPVHWMTKGIPARSKGLIQGFDLDKNVKALPPGLIQNE